MADDLYSWLDGFAEDRAGLLGTTQKLRVLMIDDEEPLCELTGKFLAEVEGAAFDFEYVLKADKGLEKLLRGEHDVYLVDFRIGAADGLELVRKAVAAGCDAAIVMLTAHGSRELELKSMEAGAELFLEKERMDPTLLERSIRLVLDRHRLRRSLAERARELEAANAEAALRASEILRSIEFPPEYHLAGTAILSYFATVIRDKYPDTPVGVTIKQESLRVTMVIETPEGKREEIEQTLEEYGLVVQGEMPIEQFLSDPLQAMEFRNQLRYAEAQIEVQNEMLAIQRTTIERQENHLVRQDARIDQLLGLVGKGLERQPEIHIHATYTNAPVMDASAFSTAHAYQTFNLSAHLAPIQDLLAELARELPDNDRQQIESAVKELEHLTPGASTEEAKSRLSRVRKVVEDLGDEKSSLAKTLKGVRRGVEIARELARQYNAVAQWCGLPVVPEPLLGKAKQSQ